MTAGAEKMVFGGDKQEQVNMLVGNEEKVGARGEDTPVKQKEFYWDQITWILVSAILGLSFLDISIEFFRGSEVQCYFEIENFTLAKSAFINSFCYGSLPPTQYYLIFILISALIIIAPHHLWGAYFAAHFDFFFDLIKKLDRLRDSSTGEYNPQNFERVKKLEEKFSKSRIFRLYKMKLALQFVISIVVLFINIFYFPKADFNEEFKCPKDCIPADGNASASPDRPNCTDIWPLDQQVTCVYNSLKLLSFLHETAYGLLGLTIVVLIIGLVWIFGRHTTELGAKEIADFSFTSCLPPESFAFPSWTALLIKFKGERLNPSSRSKDCKACCTCCKSLYQKVVRFLSPYVKPCIQDDLDFLLMRLFRADSGHGQVFKDIQVAKYLQMNITEDHQRLYLLSKIHERIGFEYDLAKELKRKQATVSNWGPLACLLPYQLEKKRGRSRER